MSLIWYRSAVTLTQTTHFQAQLLKYQLLTMSYSCIDASCLRKNKTTPMGFEPTRAEHIGLAVQRLNHSATVSHGNTTGFYYYNSKLLINKIQENFFWRLLFFNLFVSKFFSEINFQNFLIEFTKTGPSGVQVNTSVQRPSRPTSLYSDTEAHNSDARHSDARPPKNSKTTPDRTRKLVLTTGTALPGVHNAQNQEPQR